MAVTPVYTISVWIVISEGVQEVNQENKNCKLLATEIPGLFFLFFSKERKSNILFNKTAKIQFPFCICTSCQHIVWVKILQFLIKKQSEKVKFTNCMTKKLHLTELLAPNFSINCSKLQLLTTNFSTIAYKNVNVGSYFSRSSFISWILVCTEANSLP